MGNTSTFMCNTACTLLRLLLADHVQIPLHQCGNAMKNCSVRFERLRPCDGAFELPHLLTTQTLCISICGLHIVHRGQKVAKRRGQNSKLAFSFCSLPILQRDAAPCLQRQATAQAANCRGWSNTCRPTLQAPPTFLGAPL